MTAIFSVLQVKHEAGGNRVRLNTVLIAADTSPEAERTWKLWAATQIDFHAIHKAFIVNESNEDVKLLRSVNAVEVLDIDAFESWRASATRSYSDSGELVPAAWREIPS
ncbi:hypothetical protein ACU4GI_47140 (plasmid) [Cupriavidus basilensis]